MSRDAGASSDAYAESEAFMAAVERVKHERPVLTGARWSESSRCPRMAVYTARGVLGEAPGPRLQGLYERGHDVEDAWVRRLAEGYSGPIMREYAVKWGDNYEAHVDVHLPALGEFIEVKSTTQPDKLPGVPVTIPDLGYGFETTSAVIQVAGAAVFDGFPGQAKAEIVAVSPVDYAERRYPVALSQPLVDAVHVVATTVTAALAAGTTPPRTCRTPSDAVGKMCPHAAVCFQDWQPAEDAALPLEVATLAEGLATADAAIREAEGVVKEMRAERDEVRAKLRDYIPTIGEPYRAGRAQVKLSGVKARESFDLSGYRKAGHTLPAELAGWVKVGEPGVRWSVTIIDEEGE